MSAGKQPPKLLVHILKKIIRSQDVESLPGDFEEIFNYIALKSGYAKAVLWYIFQIMKLIPPFIFNTIFWSFIMLKNYLKITFRNVKRYKGYSFINIIGLSTGLACCILIILFVRNELNFDNYHEHGKNIYRVTIETIHSGKPFFMAPTMLPLGPALQRDFPEIEYAVRISEKSSILVSSEDNRFYERVLFVDPDIFNIFTFPLLTGESKTCLSEPFSLVITKKFAEKYFGTENPVGKILTLENEQDYKITGILEEVPYNSHFRFAVLASFSSLNNTERVRSNNWTRFSNDYTYVLLSRTSNAGEVERKFPGFLRSYMTEEAETMYKLHLQPLRDIHFSSLAYDFARTYEKSYLYFLSAVALFILLIACINFMNLATARSAGRVKEVGLRKVIGAQRIQLIRQFISESVLMSLFTLLIALVFVQLLLPGFSSLVNRKITFNPIDDFPMTGGLLVLSLFVGIISGSYPALFLSAFQPVQVLKGNDSAGYTRFLFRMILVVFQFLISLIFIVATLVIEDQIDYMKNRDVGFNKEQIVVIPFQSDSFRKNYEPFKHKVVSNPSILGASASNGTPASGRSNSSTFYAEGLPDGENIYLDILYTDYDFIETYGLQRRRLY